MFNEFNEGAGGAIPDLTQPSKAALIHLLRHKETWPQGFDFLFALSCRCAMGLAVAVWPEQVRHYNTDDVSAAIGIHPSTGQRIFALGRGGDSTAEDIAELLEEV